MIRIRLVCRVVWRLAGWAGCCLSSPVKCLRLLVRFFCRTWCRESGDCPRCSSGAARRYVDVFLDVGGYDESFDYYAEEYDLCARLLLAGGRVRLDRRFKVEHHKVEEGRDFNRIVHRLVRNNGWVMRRYAPERLRSVALRETVERYGRIAAKEDARWGYACGVEELSRTAFGQPMRTMSEGLWERFTGVEERGGRSAGVERSSVFVGGYGVLRER